MCGVTLLALLALFFHITALGEPQANVTERGAASKVLCSHKSWWPTTRRTEVRLKPKPRHKETSNYLEGRDERKGWKTQLTKTSWFFFTLIAHCNYQGKVLPPPLKEFSHWILQFSACFSAVKIKGRRCHIAMTARHGSESREGKANFVMSHQRTFQQGMTSHHKIRHLALILEQSTILSSNHFWLQVLPFCPPTCFWHKCLRVLPSTWAPRAAAPPFHPCASRGLPPTMHMGEHTEGTTATAVTAPLSMIATAKGDTPQQFKSDN